MIDGLERESDVHQNYFSDAIYVLIGMHQVKRLVLLRIGKVEHARVCVCVYYIY